MYRSSSKLKKRRHYLGSVTKLDTFTFDEGSGSYSSCSFVQNDKMYIVGGDRYRDLDRQISIVESCRLRKVGELKNSFINGACNKFRNSDGKEMALLCFGYDHQQGCIRYRLKLFNYNGDIFYTHFFTHIFLHTFFYTHFFTHIFLHTFFLHQKFFFIFTPKFLLFYPKNFAFFEI